MKKYIFIAILLVFPFFLAGCLNKTATTTSDNSDSTGTKTTDSDSEEMNIMGSLADLLKLGKSLKCTGEYKDEETEMSMTVYASGEKSYTESQTKMNGEEFKGYSIYDGEWVYTWGDQMENGTKMKVEDVEDLEADTPHPDEEIDEEAIEASKEYMENFNYKCMPWIPNADKFTPPSDIEFIDMSTFMQDISESMESGDMDSMMESACAACDMMADETAKAECKANLGCE